MQRRELIGFTGRYVDSESGLYYYRARYFSANLGRFLGRDPSGYSSGNNFYEYCGGNPANGADPTGLDVIVIGSRPVDLDANGPPIMQLIFRHLFLEYWTSASGSTSAPFNFGEHVTPEKLTQLGFTRTSRIELLGDFSGFNFAGNIYVKPMIETSVGLNIAVPQDHLPTLMGFPLVTSYPVNLPIPISAMHIGTPTNRPDASDVLAVLKSDQYSTLSDYKKEPAGELTAFWGRLEDKARNYPFAENTDQNGILPSPLKRFPFSVYGFPSSTDVSAAIDAHIPNAIVALENLTPQNIKQPTVYFLSGLQNYPGNNSNTFIRWMIQNLARTKTWEWDVAVTASGLSPTVDSLFPGLSHVGNEYAREPSWHLDGSTLVIPFFNNYIQGCARKEYPVFGPWIPKDSSP